MLNKIFKLFILLTLATGFAWQINAAWVSISPPKFEIEQDPWTTYDGIIKVTNGNPTSLTLQSDAQDFVASWETGQPKFLSSLGNTWSLSIARWITINNWELINLKAWEKKEIPFTINLPLDAEPWWHYWAIFFFSPNDSWQISVVQKIWSLILVKVSWEIREEWRLTEFGVFPGNIKWDDQTSVKSQSFFEKLPINFSIRFENTWNVHLKPVWKIEIFDMFWKQVKSLWVKSIVNDRWVEIKKQIVDYVPVNNINWNVLSQSIRKFDSQWIGTPFWYYNENWTKVIKYKWFVVWSYKVKLSLTWAKWEQINREIEIIIFPWKEIWWWTLWFILFVFLFVKYRKWSRKRLEARIRKEVEAHHKKSLKDKEE